MRVCVEEVEELDEGVVWHLLSRVAHLLPLDLHIVVLVFLVVLVVRLRLQRRAVCIWIEVVHVWEPHVSKLSFFTVLAYVDLAVVAVRWRIFVFRKCWKSRHFAVS